MRKLVAAVALTVAFAAPASADLAKGVEALQAQDYKTARSELEPLAQKGDAEAQYRLGLMHENGWGVIANSSLAWRWFKAAGNAGHVPAMLKVAEYHELGIGIPRSRRDAYEWYLKAAQKGDAGAMTRVAEYNLVGGAKRPNFLEGRKWLNKAVKAGDPRALELMEEFTAKGFRMAEVEGSADPADPAARAVLDEVLGLVEPMQRAVAGSPRLKIPHDAVVATKDGAYQVSLPAVQYRTPEGAVFNFGVVQALFRPQGADYRVEMQLPSRAHYAAPGGRKGAVTFEGGRLTGTWSTTLHNITDYRLETGRVRFDVANCGVLAADGIAAERRYKPVAANVFDVSETAEFKGAVFAVNCGASDDGSLMRTASISVKGTYSHFDAEAARAAGERLGMDWRTGVMVGMPDLNALSREGLPPVLGAVAVGATVSDIVVSEKEGAELFRVGKAEFALAGTGLDDDLGTLSFAYRHEGARPAAGASGMAMFPQTARLGASVNRLPLQAIMRSAARMLSDCLAAAARGRSCGGMRNGMNVVSLKFPEMFGGPLIEAMSEARTELRIDEFTLSAEAYDTSVTGAVRPAGDGIDAAFDIRIRGLDALRKASEEGEEEMAIGLGDQVLALARKEKDGAGRAIDVFRVAIQPSGRITVNGKELTTEPTY